MFRDTRNLLNPSRWSIIHYTDEKSEESEPPARRPSAQTRNGTTQTKAGRLPCAEYARRALARSIVRARMTPEMLTLLRQITGMANNLNQLARMAHVAGYGRDTATLAAMVDRIDALLTRIDKLP